MSTWVRVLTEPECEHARKPSACKYLSQSLPQSHVAQHGGTRRHRGVRKGVRKGTREGVATLKV